MSCTSLPKWPTPRRPIDSTGERAPRGAMRLRALRPSCVGFCPDRVYAGGVPDAPTPASIVPAAARPIRMVAGAICGGVLRAIDWLFFAVISTTVVLYQIVSFHHYIVDAIIWRSPKPPPRPPAHAG